MSAHEDAKKDRINRYKDLEIKYETLADTLWKMAREKETVIPLGQPLMRGHHSYQKDLKYRAKIQAVRQRANEAQKKAEYFKQKAISVAQNTAISSRDSDAIILLETKLENLMAKRDFIKTINKKVNIAKSAEEIAFLLTDDEIKEYLNRIKSSMEENRDGVPKISSYVLKNLGANIRAIQKRLEALLSLDSREIEDITTNGVSVCYNEEMRTIEIEFPGKPSKMIRDNLKGNGFKWVKSCGFWRVNYSELRWGVAVQIANNIFSLSPG